MVRYSGVDPDARFIFRRPLSVPLTSRRWSSPPIVAPTEIRYQGKFTRLSMLLRQRRLLLDATATSLEVRVGDRDELLDVLVLGGLHFPEFGDPA